MKELITPWNQLGDAWISWLLERSLAGAIALGVVLAVLFLLLLLQRRPSAHLPSWLLLLPMLVLVVPVERLLPVSWSGPLPAVFVSNDASDGTLRMPFSTPPATQPLPPSQAAYADDLPGHPAQTSAKKLPAPRWTAVAMAVWSLALALGVRHLWRRQRRATRDLERASRPAEAALRRRFARMTRAAGVRGDIALRLAPGLPSPLVAGVRRPTVYLPPDLVASLAEAQLDFALRHELEHVRRHDVLIGSLTAIVRLAFCFHPGAWLATGLLARWREYACDEAALARAAGRRTDIADTLLTLVERACGSTPPAPANALLPSPRNFMKTRLIRILDSQRLPQARMSASAAALLGLASLGTLTAAHSQQAVPEPVRVVHSTPAAPTQDPVAIALTEAASWLLQNQQADGSWAIGPDPSGKNQRDHNNVCVTAMAVRALLPSLRQEKLRIAQAVRRAATFLEQSQQAHGRFGADEPMTMMYAHAQALRALCAVQREWPDAQRLERIELGVAYALKARNPHMGWRYQPRDNDNDSKITAMMLLGLHAAKNLGVAIEEAVFREATQLLDQLTAAENGRTGFVRRGQTMSRFTSKKAHFPGELSEEPTALNLLVRQAAGEGLDDNEVYRRGVALIAALPPEWNEDKGSIDLAYWEFGAEVMAIVGGAEAEQWKAKLHAALIPNRIITEGCAHWPAVDAWSHPGMEAYATASAILALRAFD